MRSFLTLLATTLFLVAAAHADGIDEHSASTSMAQLEKNNWAASQVSLAQGSSKSESPSGQQDDSDDCT
jgi:hypothetical protein